MIAYHLYTFPKVITPFANQTKLILGHSITANDHLVPKHLHDNKPEADSNEFTCVVNWNMVPGKDFYDPPLKHAGF